MLVFADFDAVSGGEGEPIEVPIGSDDALGNEWAVVIDAPGYSACLLAWEPPRPEDALPVPDRMRRFEALWTLDPDVVRRAAMVGGALAGRADASSARAWRACSPTGRSRSSSRRRRSPRSPTGSSATSRAEPSRRGARSA